MLPQTIKQLFIEETIVSFFNTRIYLVFLGNELFNFSGHPRQITVVANFSFMWYILFRMFKAVLEKMDTWA